jgi:hypothetical protein
MVCCRPGITTLAWLGYAGGMSECRCGHRFTSLKVVVGLALGSLSLLGAVARADELYGTTMFAMFSAAFVWSAWTNVSTTRFAFSLRSLLIVTAVSCAIAAWVASEFHVTIQRRELLAEVTNRGALCIHTHCAKWPPLRRFFGDKVLTSIILPVQLTDAEIVEFEALFSEAFLSQVCPDGSDCSLRPVGKKSLSEMRSGE